ATSKHSVRSESFFVTPFSVTTGRLITSINEFIAGPPKVFGLPRRTQQPAESIEPRSLQALRKLSGRRLAEKHMLMAEEIVDIHVAAGHQLHPLQIAAGKLKVGVI